MELVKIGLVMLVGLGSTWAAREATDWWLGPPARLAQTAESQSQPAGSEQGATAPTQPDPAPAEGKSAESSPPTVPEISREEMEAELKRAQAEIAGKPGAGELEEFRPSKPLPADIGIALPSDM